MIVPAVVATLAATLVAAIGIASTVVASEEIWIFVVVDHGDTPKS